MGKEYCYKVKSNYIKVDEKNAYKKPLIEQFGFMPIQEEYEDEEGNKYYIWAEGWAKNIKLPPKSPVAKWIKGNIESIYKKESEKEGGDSKWLNEILEAGYEFDEEGKLVENEQYLNNLDAQLCIMHTGELSGTLFINLGGSVEFYDSKALLGSAFADVMRLIKADVVYKKCLFVKDRKESKKKAKKHDRKKYN